MPLKVGTTNIDDVKEGNFTIASAFRGNVRVYGEGGDSDCYQIRTPSGALMGLSQSLDAKCLSSYPGTGTTWFDISGHGRNGTISGATYTPSSPNYFDLDGTNDSVNIGNWEFSNDPSQDGRRNFVTWMYLEQYPTGTEQYTIASQWEESTNNRSWRTFITASTVNPGGAYIGFELSNSGSSTSYSGTATVNDTNCQVPLDKWFMVSYYMNGDGLGKQITINILYDGAFQTGYGNGINPSDVPYEVTNDVQVGRTDITSTRDYFKGRIAQWAYWNRADSVVNFFLATTDSYE